MSRLFVVEDEKIVIEDIAQTLRQLGYEVAGTAQNVVEALLAVEHIRPDLILMDIQLAGRIDGIQTTAAIRKRWAIPVIYLTAHSDDATLARAKETGPHGYLLKPFQERELRTAIEVALRKHELEQTTAGLAHELNNPLSATVGNVDYVEARLAELEAEAARKPESARLANDLREIRGAVRDAQVAGNRMRKLVRDLRKFTCAEELTKEMIDLPDVLQSAIHATHHLLGANMTFAVRLGTTPLVEANEGQLVRLFAI